MVLQHHYKLNDYWCMKHNVAGWGEQSSKIRKTCPSRGSLHLELCENLGFSVHNTASYKSSNLLPSKQRKTQDPICSASAFPLSKTIQNHLSNSLNSHAENLRMPSAVLHLHLTLNCASGKFHTLPTKLQPLIPAALPISACYLLSYKDICSWTL